MTTNNTGKNKSSISWLLRYTIAFAALFVTIIGLGTISNSPQSAGTPDSFQTCTHTDIIDIVHQTLGESTTREVPKIQGVIVNDFSDGYIVKVRFAIDDNRSAGNPIKSGAQEDIQDVMKALYQSQALIAFVQITGTFPVADSYGFVRETEVLKCGLSAATAQEIDWDNIHHDELFDLLDSLWWHSSI